MFFSSFPCKHFWVYGAKIKHQSCRQASVKTLAITRPWISNKYKNSRMNYTLKLILTQFALAAWRRSSEKLIELEWNRLRWGDTFTSGLQRSHPRPSNTTPPHPHTPIFVVPHPPLVQSVYSPAVHTCLFTGFFPQPTDTQSGGLEPLNFPQEQMGAWVRVRVQLRACVRAYLSICVSSAIDRQPVQGFPCLLHSSLPTH